MAGVEDIEHKVVVAEQRTVVQRQDAITRYGEALGEAYFNFAHGNPSTFEEQAEHREAFADAIVTVLEGGMHEERVKGITALLSSLEEKIAPVARQATAAYSRTRIID